MDVKAGITNVIADARGKIAIGNLLLEPNGHLHFNANGGNIMVGKFADQTGGRGVTVSKRGAGSIAYGAHSISLI